MKIIRIIFSILAISFGAFLIVYGERDDSPGGQVIGLVLVVFGIVSLIKSEKKILNKPQHKKDFINY